jgi:hypothetical protein
MFIMQSGENGGMVLTFDKGDEQVATATLVELTRDIMLDILARNPESIFTTNDLKAEIDSMKVEAGDRTLKSVFASLKGHPLVECSKQGRMNVFKYVGEVE